ncbi:MAG: glycosyltransferase [Bacteroidia bacterium]|nr:glycosyltransferase [Bacteroidia bacterium]
MASDPRIFRIGYAGRLRGHIPGSEKPGLGGWFRQMFWEYRVKTVDPSTRSGYFLLKGIQKLKETRPEVVAALRLNFWGSIDPVLKVQAKEMGVEEVLEIEGYKSRDETMQQLATCQVMFLPLESGLGGQRPLFIPGKLYEYLQLGKPVLALAPESDCREILLKSGLAKVCDPRNEIEIADGLLELYEKKDQKEEEFRPDFEYIRSNFSFEALTGKLAAVFDQVLTP